MTSVFSEPAIWYGQNQGEWFRRSYEEPSISHPTQTQIAQFGELQTNEGRPAVGRKLTFLLLPNVGGIGYVTRIWLRRTPDSSFAR